MTFLGLLHAIDIAAVILGGNFLPDACGRSVRESYSFQIMSNIDISVAVATPSGLITPIVKDVPSKSIADISSNIKELAARAKENKLQLDEFQVGTRCPLRRQWLQGVH